MAEEIGERRERDAKRGAWGRGDKSKGEACSASSSWCMHTLCAYSVRSNSTCSNETLHIHGVQHGRANLIREAPLVRPRKHHRPLHPICRLLLALLLLT